jgi:hypothetical protein
MSSESEVEIEIDEESQKMIPSEFVLDPLEHSQEVARNTAREFMKVKQAQSEQSEKLDKVAHELSVTGGTLRALLKLYLENTDQLKPKEKASSPKLSVPKKRKLLLLSLPYAKRETPSRFINKLVKSPSSDSDVSEISNHRSDSKSSSSSSSSDSGEESLSRHKVF